MVRKISNRFGVEIWPWDRAGKVTIDRSSGPQTFVGNAIQNHGFQSFDAAHTFAQIKHTLLAYRAMPTRNGKYLPGHCTMGDGHVLFSIVHFGAVVALWADHLCNITSFYSISISIES